MHWRPLPTPQIVAALAGRVGVDLLLGLKKFWLVWLLSMSGHLAGADTRGSLEPWKLKKSPVRGVARILLARRTSH